jgi:hypothetical protein
MGNRSSGSRRKGRDSAYTYSDNRQNEYTPNKNNGSINRRQYQSPPTSYHQQPNGYVGTSITQITNSYNKPNPSKFL